MKKRIKKIRTRIKQFRKNSWKWAINNWKKLAIGLVVVLIIAGWFYQQTQANKEDLTFAHPEYRDLTKILDVSGVVDAKEHATLRFAAGGKVVYLGAQEGDTVSKWQTIATIDQRTLQKQIEQDLNNYLKERWDWESSQDEYDYHVEDLATRRTLDKEQWDLENQVLNVEIRDIAISNTVLSAPFAGVLVSSPTNVAGVTLLATDVFELVNPETLAFKAAVDEADISLVQQGQQGEIFLDSYPDEAISTNISYIAYKSSASSTGTVFLIEFPIASTDLAKYRLGMNGDVEIKLEAKEQVLSVPLEATRQRGDKTYVDVRASDGYEEREIQTGLETEDFVEVLSGLSENDEILIPEN